MSDTVFANGMAVVHAGSSGKSPMAFPDVCLCPPSPPAGPVPTPLPNTASAADLAGGASSVKVDGNPVAKKSSFISKSTGDEAGRSTGGGVVTHVVQGKAYFQSYSMDVLVEGENVARHLDLTTHNHASPPPNTPPFPYLSKMDLPQQTRLTDKHWVAGIMEVVTSGGREKLVVARSRRQYVNLDAQVKRSEVHQEYGRVVKVQARVVAYGEGGKASPASYPVHFWCKPGPHNASGLSGDHGAGFDKAGSGTMQKTVQSGDDGWTPTVEFHLSDRGGDEFTLYASEHKEGEKGSDPARAGPFKAWRCVFYQVTKMDPAPDGTKFHPPADAIEKLRASLAPVCIDLKPGTKSAAATAYRENLLEADRTSVENATKAAANDDTVPFKTNIIFVDHANTDQVKTDEGTLPATATAAVPRAVPARGAAAAAVATDWFDYMPNPIVRALFRHVGGIGGDGPWQNLANVRVEVHPNYPAGTVAAIDRLVRLVGEIPDRDPTFEYEFAFEYRTVAVSAGGWGGTAGTLFICVGSDRRKGAALPSGTDVQQILTHEIGHAFGLVPGTASWRDTDPRDDGYSLRHCGYKHGDGTPRCVMWWQLGGGAGRYDYCSSNAPNDCSHFLRAAELGRAAMKWLK